MTKKELKTGMRVKTRDGNFYIILIDTPDWSYLVNNSEYLILSEYREDLTDKDYNKFDIIEVYNTPYNIAAMLDVGAIGHIIWRRKEEKTYTIDGVEYSESSLRSLIKKATQ